MATSLLERLPRLVAHGRRQAQRLVHAVAGRHRERAVPIEIVAAPDDPLPPIGLPARRLLCGAPALSLAALIAEHRQGGGTKIGRIVVDLRPPCDAEPLATRLARWAPCLALLRDVAPGASLALHIAPDERAIVQLVLDAFALTESTASDLPDAGTLLLADDASRLSALALPHRRWIACMHDAAGCATVRRTLLLRGDTTFRVEDVGAAPAEWMRRHAAQPLNAMHAALLAFGATPLAQTAACATPAGRRRAGADVLLGDMRRDGVRTLVWVDAPDRRTGEATLCRAITRRELGGYDRVVILGWHVAPNLGQHLALRSDRHVDVRTIRCFPRGERGPALRVDPRGFGPVEGLSHAWVQRERSLSAPEVEWIIVQLGEAPGEPVVDWAVDPAHDGEVFRGAWHALRDAHAGVRAVRVRVPWHDGPRRVCLRAIGADGRASELLFVVHPREPMPHVRVATCARAPARTQSEALC
jgi:hypothetical protein